MFFYTWGSSDTGFAEAPGVFIGLDAAVCIYTQQKEKGH